MTTFPARHGALLAATLLACAIPSARASAQIRASEVATVSQTVDGTVISLEYSRPRLRGRTGVFGSRAVRWGETWTPGANWATTVDVSRDLTIDGRPVAKGRYSVWLIVRKEGDWTLLLDPRVKRFHMNPPDSSAAQLRIPVRPEHGPATEVLTWAFPEVGASGAILAMQWDTVRVPLDIRVSPSLPSTMAASAAQPLVGSYEIVHQDSNSHFTKVVVLYEQGTLKAEFVPAHSYFKRFALIQVGPDSFVPGLYDTKGEIYEVMRPDVSITFGRTPQGIRSLEARDQDDALWWSAARKR